ncbi:MAG: NADH:ubiquinone oxidoreductase subunit NDUFA12 [Pseudomonadota bacterium]
MFARIFTWWNSATFGTALTLFRRGARLVGKDEQGNRYYEEARPSSADGAKRRWVVYHGVADASRVTPDWHGWLHHTFEDPPTDAPFKRHGWEKDHVPNMTGTPLAYRPDGSLARPGGAHKVKDDYEAWDPESA